MKKLLIGRSPLTTIAGLILAMLISIQQAGAEGAHRWQDFILPAAIALFGRLAADDNKRPPLPPFPMPSPARFPDLPVQPATFQRRGRQHSQHRNQAGRFAPATA